MDVDKKMDQILEQVPDYQYFFTASEMDQRSFDLAKRFQDVVSVEKIGESRDKKPLYCLKIGKGSKTALLYGTPHPNEPIGSMMLDALSEILAANDELRESMDYTWYMIKSSDIDGLEKNAGWLKGPFTITNYQTHFFRPAFDQQVEWSFPVKYKNYEFNAPIPETQSIMRLIERVKPDFIYSLHNAGFGGAYWYMTDGEEELYKKMHQAALKQQIPLSLGEPEEPFCQRYADAIYQMTGLKARYDYYEEFLPNGNPEELLSGGCCSVEYAKEHVVPQVRMLVTEVPYYSNPVIASTKVTDIKRRDAVRVGYKLYLDDLKFAQSIYEQISNLFSIKNQFYLAVKEKLASIDSIEAGLKKLEMDTKDDPFATESQVFSSQQNMRFYSNLSLVLLRRACEEELQASVKGQTIFAGDVPEPANDFAEMSADKKMLLEAARDKVLTRERANLQDMEEHIEYEAIPIANLVKLQLECGLLYAQYVHDKSSR